MADTAAIRQPHAVLDLQSRRWKGLKIERLLGLSERPGPMRMLEIGTGSGGIAHYFAAHASGRFTVDAVDVADQRLVSDGYRFTLVSGTSLPFPDAAFDVVLSNHVIEHVGDRSAQRAHLDELARVLRPDGVGYLAEPNRWMLFEPHYRLVFLSWLPRPLRSPYLQLMRRGDVYDCEPLAMAELEQMLLERFEIENLCTGALRETVNIENVKSWLARTAAALPGGLLAQLHPVFPTLIYKLTHRSIAAAPR